MRWEDGRRSDNVEDRRGFGRRGVQLGGGAGLLALVLALLGAPQKLVEIVGGMGSGSPADDVGEQRRTSPAEDRAADFVAVVLGDTEDTWGALFRQQGRTYQRPKLVLFTEAAQSGCGYASAAVGPFYCPVDRKVYLDLQFFAELDRRYGAPGDFAQAYVVAHEVGHHVQTLLGTSQRVHQASARLSKVEANRLSVGLELQADCFAGVWAHHAQKARKVLEPGDLEEALRAATAIGDDTLQRRARGRVVPETFTHGTSAQRVQWFRRGFQTGAVDACNTPELASR
jgi:predicted metalloprotease